MKNISQYIIKLFKSAATDIPGFYPEWVRKHPRLEKFKTLTEIEKNINQLGAEDYREIVNVDFKELFNMEEERKNLVKSFCDQIIGYLNSFERFVIMERNDSKEKENYNTFLSLISQLTDSIDQDYISNLFEKSNKLSNILVTNSNVRENIDTEVPGMGPVKKVINIPANTSLITACNMLATNYEKYIEDCEYTNILKDITDLSEFKKISYLVSDKFKKDILNKSKDTFEIVFSTKPSDLLSMSIRADWTSCQNLLKDKDVMNYKAINSAIAPNVGIIYLTNKKDYSGRGEEMIARALVFLLEKKQETNEFDDDEDDLASSFLKQHSETAEKVLNISKIYSNFNREYIMKLFQSSLKKHSKMPIAISVEGYAFKTKNMPEDDPYFDDPEMKVEYSE